MDPNKVYEFYQECINMDLSVMLELITNTKSQEERNFYTDLYNYVLRNRQRKCVADGVF